MTNKTLTSPKINENVALTATSTELNKISTLTTAGGNIIKIANGNANEFLKTNGDGTVAWAAVPSNLHDAYDGGNTITTDLGRNVIVAGNAALEVTATFGIITNKLSASVEVSSASFKSEPAVGNSTSITGGNLTSTYNGTDPAFQINSTNNLNTNAALQVSSKAGSDVGAGNLGQVARFDLDNALNNDYAVSISTNATGADAAGLNIQATGSADALQLSSTGGYGLSMGIVTNINLATGIPTGNTSGTDIVWGGGAVKLSYKFGFAGAAITIPSDVSYFVVKNAAGVNANAVTLPAGLGINDAGRILIITNNDDDALDMPPLMNDIAAGTTVQLIWDGAAWHQI